jgi:hypothetical protein
MNENFRPPQKVHGPIMIGSNARILSAQLQISLQTGEQIK